MKLPSLLDPLAPFKGWIIAILIAAVLGGLAYGAKVMYDRGHANGAAKQALADAGQLQAARETIAEKRSKLRDAAAALRAAASAIGAINAEADRRIAQAELDSKHAASAEAIAKRAEGELRSTVRTLENRLAKARGTNLDCAKLLDLDVDAELSRLGCPLN